MKRLSFHIIFVFCLLVATKGKSQQDITVSQYMFNQLFLNPAYAGTHAYWESSALYRTQWVGWEGSPTSQLIAVDGPILPSLLGIGTTIVHDQIGISNTLAANIALSYQLKLDRAGEHRLSFGLKTGYTMQRAHIEDLIYIDPNDPLYTIGITTQNTINFGAGLYYYSEKMYFGLAAPLLVAKDLSDVPTEEPNRRSYLKNQYYLNGGMVFPLSKSIDFKPSFLLKYTHAAPLQADITINFLFNKIFWAGVTYRSENMLVFILEVNATRWMRFGYAYDLNLGEISNYSSGSHEIMLSIDFGKTIVKSTSPRYF